MARRRPHMLGELMNVSYVIDTRMGGVLECRLYQYTSIQISSSREASPDTAKIEMY